MQALINPKTFIFLILNQRVKKKKFKKIKKIKNSKSDFLINEGDNINYNKYEKLNLDVVNVNKANDIHSIEVELNNKSMIYKDEFIYLEVYSDMGVLKCFYNLEVN